MIKNKKIDIEHVARLANLRFSAKEKGIIENQLNDILSHVEKLNELDTSAIEPASHVIPVKNVFRADALSPSLSLEDSLGGSPDKEDRFFKVPKIIGG